MGRLNMNFQQALEDSDANANTLSVTWQLLCGCWGDLWYKVVRLSLSFWGCYVVTMYVFVIYGQGSCI